MADHQQQATGTQSTDTTPAWEPHTCTFDCNDFITFGNQEFCVRSTSISIPANQRLTDLSEMARATNLRHLTVSLGLVREDTGDMMSVRHDIPLGPEGPVYHYVPVIHLVHASLSPLGGLTNLEALTLSIDFDGAPMQMHDVLVRELDIGELREMTNLTRLTLTSQGNRRNTTSVVNAEVLSRFTNLTFLQIYGFSFEDLGPLSNLTGLQELRLDSASIEDVSPLSNLTNLTRLDLGDNSITDISPLANLTNLRELDLRGNDIQRHRDALRNALPQALILW